ncbi:MAG: NADH-quinone oxidoreductase subunit C, partial [Candidatus Omnitrophica bacterium]|nr:NADH-quinone oxidoreductase subunit C [Candidatus Omnitrophota bacterium]
MPAVKAHKHDCAVIDELKMRFGDTAFTEQSSSDAIPTLWVGRGILLDVLRFVKTGINRPYRMLYDLFAIDERLRNHRDGQPSADFTVVYHLLSFDRNSDLRLKVALEGEYPSLPSCVG